jgi:hypothetical protein
MIGMRASRSSPKDEDPRLTGNLSRMTSLLSIESSSANRALESSPTGPRLFQEGMRPGITSGEISVEGLQPLT